MAWGYAKHRFGYTWTLDSDEWNDNIVPFASEMNGGLNEQNWLSLSGADYFMGSAANGGLAEYDTVARVFVDKTSVDPLGATGSMFEIKQSTKWVPITPSTKGPFTSRGGLAQIIISFQMHVPTVATSMSGLNFAIEVDGVVRVDSLLGTGDHGNDFLDNGASVTFAGGTPQFNWGSSPSFRSALEPKMVKCLVRLEQGQHTVRLVARNLFLVGGGAAQYISQIETIVIDCWA